MRIMTWNIHGCVGTDGRRDPERVAAGVGSVRPDIFAVQEIDIRGRHKDAVHLLDRIAEHAGDNRYEAYTITDGDRRYGIALYSHWDIHSVTVHDLAWRKREPRRAIDATVETPDGPVRVVATHLGLSIAERVSQIAVLAEAIGDRVDRPTILLGDFNDWRAPGRIGRVFREGFPVQVAPRSFPARLPVFPLDRILLSTHLTGRALPVRIPVAASDHRAVAAQVSFRD